MAKSKLNKRGGDGGGEEWMQERKEGNKTKKKGEGKGGLRKREKLLNDAKRKRREDWMKERKKGGQEI